MGKTQPVIWAAFDFDGTLTRRDSLLPFLRHACSPLEFARKAARLTPVVGAYALGIMSNERAKEQVLARFFGGGPITRVDTLGEAFAERHLPALLLDRAMDRLAWHRAQGHACVLVSASLVHYLEPWARRVGFEHVIATRLEADSQGRVTGRLHGGNCYGAEKARRLRTLIDGQDYTLYAYGDSRGDREMLAMAHHPYYRQMPTGNGP